MTWNMFVAMVLPLGLPTALQRFYPDVADDAERRRETIGTLHGIALVAVIAYSLLVLPFCGVFLGVFNATSAPKEVFYLSIVLVVLTSWFSLPQALHQAAGRKYYFAGLGVLNFTVATVLGFALVYWFQQGVVGFFRASVAALVLTVVGSLFVTQDIVGVAFSMSVARRLLNYSLPFVWVFLVFESANVLDRFLIAHFLSLSDVGVFAVANKVAGVTGLAISSFAVAWFPYAMRVKSQPDARYLYAKIFVLYVAGTAALVSGICIFRSEIIRVIAPGYVAAYGTIAILSVYYAIAGSVSIVTVGLHIAERTRYIAGAALASVATNAVASAVLVQVVGLEGIAYGSLLGSLVWIVLQVRRAQTFYRIPFSYRLCFKSGGLVAAVAYGGAYLDLWLGTVRTAVGIGVKGVVFAAILAATYYGCLAEVRTGPRVSADAR